jgi:23S rRNA (cytosine1962-C5)-methyltransferase
MRDMEPTVVISDRGRERIRHGHPWIYRADVVEARARGGEIVAVVGPRGRPLGRALFSDRSEITLRLLTRGEEPADLTLWRRRLEQAVAYRRELAIEGTACRLVHAEADRLPSLVVDRYADCLVVQALSQAVDRLLPDITRLLVELLEPAGVLARNDPKVRQLEGLERRVELLYGQVPPTIAAVEGHVQYDVDPWKGQKTGLFLDQRENHAAAAGYARGRLLDCFSYQGGFALAMAARCEGVLALDVSEEAITVLAANAARNGIGSIESRAVNVFDELRELERAGQQFQTIVLDPPAFAKNKAAVPKATAGYKEINLRALKLLAPGGHLVTCSCSYNIDDHTFRRIVASAALDAHATVTLVEARQQARDHPVLVGVPETSYLKCLILRKLES